MALLELKTNLKSLKHSDTGTRNLLVSKDINDPPKTGGISMQINHRIDDLARHVKLLVRKPGLKFLGNQALLAQTNIKQDIAKFMAKDADGKPLYSGKQKLQALGQRAKDTAIDTVLATASILAQIPLNGTGTHLIRGLKDNSYLGKQGMKQAHLSAPDGSIIPNIAPDAPEAGGRFIVVDNFQVTSLGKLSNNRWNSGVTFDRFLGTFILSQKNDYINNETSEPRKLVKNGKKAFVDNTGGEGWNPPQESAVVVDPKPQPTITVKPVANQPTRSYRQRPSVGYEDNQQQYIKDINIDGTEVFYSDQITVTGNRSKDESRKDREKRSSVVPAVDKPDAVQSLAVQTATILGSDKQDIIPFEFNVFTPGDSTGKFLYFRAFLGGLNDNYSGDWSGTKYVGRGEDLYNYQGFKRDISFDFKIAAFSKKDIDPLYEKLNKLVGSTAPTYGAGSFMRGTLTKITIGDYLKNVSGFISSVGVKWDVGYPWDIDNEGEGNKMLPHILDVSVAFTPIHDFVPTANSTFIG